jgi:single-strand DNA-binding protein
MFDIFSTITGNLTADPELRYTPTGKAVAKLRIASTPRRPDGNGWTDGQTTYLDIEVWGPTAENVAESLGKGDRAIASGKLITQAWQSDNGPRSKLVLVAEEVGPSLRYATAKPVKT